MPAKDDLDDLEAKCVDAVAAGWTDALPRAGCWRRSRASPTPWTKPSARSRAFFLLAVAVGAAI